MKTSGEKLRTISEIECERKLHNSESHATFAAEEKQTNYKVFGADNTDRGVSKGSSPPYRQVIYKLLTVYFEVPLKHQLIGIDGAATSDRS